MKKRIDEVKAVVDKKTPEVVKDIDRKELRKLHNRKHFKAVKKMV